MNINPIRKVVLDTETTGMNKFGKYHEGHKIIEIGAVEIIDRCVTNNQFHIYLNPNRSIDLEAFQIHGINDQFLLDKPIFKNIMDKFLAFIHNSELIIHNAPFDLDFLNYELKYANSSCKNIESICTVTDSLKIARQMFPGQRNSLDALCDRYSIDKSHRLLHNALVDARILAYIYLCMTGGQLKMNFLETLSLNPLKISESYLQQFRYDIKETKNINNGMSLKVLYANETEQLEHEKYLDLIEFSNKNCLWKKLN